jgi:hypothetical protein
VSAILLQPAEITSILLSRGWIADQDQVRLLPAQDSSDRRGVITSGVWFRIGRNLGGLYDRAQGFHDACPEIAAKPLWFFEEAGFDWFGCEHATQPQALRDDQMTHAISVIEQALAATEVPSTTAAAETEIDAFLAALCQVPEFSLLDRELLTRYAGNELKATLIESHPSTRWAHGNLTPEFIRIGEAGQVRLMEPEFAARTHFFAEDWLRLGRYVNLPPNSGNAALQAYSWLRQILIDPESLRPNLARALQLLDVSNGAIRQSLLAQIAVQAGHPAPPRKNELVRTQLYFSQTEAFSEASTVTAEISKSGWQLARFLLPLPAGAWNLRFDPAIEPGLTEIRRISVQADPGGELFSSDQPSRILQPSGTCFCVGDNSSFRVLSYGNDPQVQLPRVTIDAPSQLSVEIWMQWRSLEGGMEEFGPEIACGRPPEV